MKRILSVIIILIILTIGVNSSLAEKYHNKTIILVVDSLDFKDSEKIINDKLSMGLLNIKTRGKNEESLFLTISKGRKVQIDDGLFKELTSEGSRVDIEDYEAIKKSLDKTYPNFSQQINSLGEVLKNNNIKTSYIGNKDKSEALIISDNDGYIDYWQETSEDLKELKNQTDSMLSKSDVLLVSLDIGKDGSKKELLASYLENMSDNNLIVFPKTVSGDVKSRLNDSIVPVFYKQKDAVGIISSISTKRQGVISSLDIFPTVLGHYGIEVEGSIGNKIEVSRDDDLVEVNRNILAEFLNLNLVKYVMHVVTVLTCLYTLFLFVLKKQDFKKIRILLLSVVVSVPVSIFLGIFNIQRYLTIYIIMLLTMSFIISIYLEKNTKKSLEKISILTNTLILVFIFLQPTFLYNSYIGYNSIVAGGRFYGFNNEIMGVFITTSIISYYFLKDKFKSQAGSNIFLLAYFSVIIIALTGRFGANFGGFLTSITLFLMLIYLSLFNRKINKKTILSLLAIGLVILASNLYLDMKNNTGSHAGSLIERINILGFYEFIDMIIIKLKQLMYMTIAPPWSIAFLAQTYFIIASFKAIKNKVKTIPVSLVVMFITSFVVLLINDTGVVAFVYMNTYLTSKILEERYI